MHKARPPVPLTYFQAPPLEMLSRFQVMSEVEPCWCRITAALRLWWRDRGSVWCVTRGAWNTRAAALPVNRCMRAGHHKPGRGKIAYRSYLGST